MIKLLAAAVLVVIGISFPLPAYAASLTDVDHPDIPNCYHGFAEDHPGEKCETLSLQAIYGNNGLWVTARKCVKIKSATWFCQNNYG